MPPHISLDTPPPKIPYLKQLEGVVQVDAHRVRVEVGQQVDQDFVPDLLQHHLLVCWFVCLFVEGVGGLVVRVGWGRRRRGYAFDAFMTKNKTKHPRNTLIIIIPHSYLALPGLAHLAREQGAEVGGAEAQHLHLLCLLCVC